MVKDERKMRKEWGERFKRERKIKEKEQETKKKKRIKLLEKKEPRGQKNSYGRR